MSVSKDAVDDNEILGVLRGVMDPELNDNIVDLGMVRSASLRDRPLKSLSRLQQRAARFGPR